MTIPPTAPLVLDRDNQGQIVGGRRVGQDGLAAEFSIERSVEQDRAVAAATFSAGGELVVRMTSEVSSEDEFITLDISDPAGSALWWRLDFSSYDEDHLARVSMSGRGLGEFAGVYDPRLRRTNLQLIPDMWLSREQLSFLEGFRPAFEEILERFENALGPDRELIEYTIMNSRWRGLGRIACRAFASMAGAAMGLVLGGPIGAVIGTGVGSVAADGCSAIR